MNEAKTEEVREGYIWIRQKCPICEIPPTKFVGKRGGHSHRANLGVECEIWSCGKCGLIFPDPMPFPSEGISAHYEVDADAYFITHEKDEKTATANNLIARAEELLGRKGKLLDVGAGRGETLAAAENAGWSAEGIEPSSSFADHAEKSVSGKIWRQPLTELELPENGYDVVILAAVLEHLYDPNEVLAKIAKLLKTGGLLYVDVPNEQGLYFRLGNLYNKLKGRDWCVNLAPTFEPFHVMGFGPGPLRKILGKHGFDPVVWTVYGGTSMLPSRGGLLGTLEVASSKAVSSLSNIGQMGTYIETWARKT